MKTKHLSIFFIFFISSFSALSQNSLEVTITGIRNQNGNLLVGLFDSEKDFLDKAAHGKIVGVTGKEVTVVFENLPPGDYAISIVHDENENGEMDTNFIGIPKEGFAFGNNAMGTFGPPSFEKAKITLTDQIVKQEIRLKYM